MDLETETLLKSAGIDCREVLDRFMGSEELMMKFLLRFPQEPSYQAACDALEKGDAKAAYEAAHALKGVTGNLAMKPLYQAVCALVEPLRKGDLEGGRALLPPVQEKYREVIHVLALLEH